MVRGLEFFRDYFKEHSDKYFLIGGVANYLALNIAGEEARVTILFVGLGSEAQVNVKRLFEILLLKINKKIIWI